MKTYTIDCSILYKLEEKLKSFKNKFAKYGNGDITYEVSAPYSIKKDNHQQQVVVDVTVDATYRISGYSFVALLEMTDNGNLIKKASDDVFVPDEFRNRSACDHCKSNRVRKYTVLLKNDTTGDYIQVGKECVKDYLGRDIADYASYLSFYEKLDEDVEYMGAMLTHYTPCFSFDEIIEQTLEYVKRFGYKSKAQAYEFGGVATSTAVYAALNNIDIDGESFEIYEVTEQSKANLVEVHKFIDELDDTSDYNHNLRTLSTLNYIENKNLGLVVSAVGAWLRSIREKKEKEATEPSNYVGNIGEKIEFKCTPTCVCSIDGMYGMTYIYKMMLGNDVLIWKTNKFFEDGVEVTIKATIKEHSEYRGEKQTSITRGKVVA